MNFSKFLIVTLISFSVSCFAGTEVKRLDFSQKGGQGFLTVKLNKQLNDYPEMTVEGKEVHISIPDTKVRKNLEKHIAFSSNQKDTKFKAYQSSNKASKVRVQLAFNAEKRKNEIFLTMRGNNIELSFPKVKVTPKKAKKAAKKVIAKSAVKKEYLDEKYLDRLLDVSPKKSPKKNAKKDSKSAELFKKKNQNNTDEVKTTLASPIRNDQEKSKSSISLLEYGGKFVAFLGLVLLLFYGIVALMKKGFIKKGKLGFFNNTEQIMVLNQTYIAPKKSLMLVKAHNQVFLVSNTDSGIHPISEIKDAAGLLKNGEKTITGHNFDTNLESSTQDENNDSKIKIKEDIMLSNKESALSSYSEIKEKVKFSDQLKKKVKNLKPLH